MSSRQSIVFGLLAIGITAGLLCAPLATADEPTPKTDANADAAPAAELPEGLDAAHAKTARDLMDKGAKYLAGKQNEDGTWTVQNGAAAPAITAMVLKALVQCPEYGPDHPVVQKGYEALLKYRQPDGGIYAKDDHAATYTAAVAMMALAAANDPNHAEVRRDLVKYLKSLQIVPGAISSDGSKVAEDDPAVGGVSYSSGPSRADLSNTGMWVQALHDGGVPGDDPAMQRAVAFISRMQNNSETNKMAWVEDAGDDGGFIYTLPRSGGPGGRGGRGGRQRQVRSYGSMSYTGLKSLLYANVDRKDPRVQAAYRWVRRFWTLDGNPNMPAGSANAGLYYYYYVFSKAMLAWGEPIVTDLKGNEHTWRNELIDALAKRVGKDGSWVNDSAGRWMENDPVLVTSYVLMALEDAVRPTKTK